jgi:hypothetical protein
MGLFRFGKWTASALHFFGACFLQKNSASVETRLENSLVANTLHFHVDSCKQFANIPRES